MFGLQGISGIGISHFGFAVVGLLGSVETVEAVLALRFGALDRDTYIQQHIHRRPLTLNP